jgi:hypothetical protein
MVFFRLMQQIAKASLLHYGYVVLENFRKDVSKGETMIFMPVFDIYGARIGEYFTSLR